MQTNGVSQQTSTAGTNQTNRADSLSQARNNQDFLQLFLSQVTQQDPLEPMNNSELMEQVIGIETIERLSQLEEGLKNLQQNDLMEGASLIGKTVRLTGGLETGRVDRVLFKDGQTKLVVGGKEVNLHEISSLEAEAA